MKIISPRDHPVLRQIIDKKHSYKQSSGMYLITMAHLGEAQGTIDKFHLIKLRPDLYKNETMVLLITGEGPFEAATKTALTLPQFDFKEVINLGIAGSLTDKFNIGDFFAVRSIYLINDLKPQFKSFPSLPTGEDCLTSFERLLDPTRTHILKGVGSLVDREAWGVAMAAKTAGVPFRAYKMISDVAGTTNACELVKEKAQEFGESLAENLSKILEIETKTHKEIDLPGFYFTFTTNHQFWTLISKLEIKFQIKLNDILSRINFEEIKDLEIRPKEKTKILIERLEHLLDPTKKILSNIQKEITEQFLKEGLKVQIDPQWENSSLVISFEAKNDSDIENKINSLRKVSLKRFSNVMKGELNVE
jgi:nucleoside phosphorylase